MINESSAFSVQSSVWRRMRKCLGFLLTLIPADNDLIVGQHYKFEGTPPTKEWIRRYYGLDHIEKIPALACVDNDPSSVFILPGKSLNQLQAHHSFQKSALLMGILLKNLVKGFWHRPLNFDLSKGNRKVKP